MSCKYTGRDLNTERDKSDSYYQGVRSRRAKRIISKTGERNVEFVNIPHRGSRYFRDVVYTMIDAQWRYVLTLFSLSYFLSWFFFATFWYLIAYTHGDLNYDLVTGERLNEGPVCIYNCKSFAEFYLFSVETQLTIGYGARYPTDECPEAVFLFIIQGIIGAAIEGSMIGVIYIKMTKPSRHVSHPNFSKKAVICQRDSKLCLVFRTCDTNHSRVINTKISAFWFEERFSLEGEKLKNLQHSLKLENEGSVFLMFPHTVCHVIDDTSPLYSVSRKELYEKKFELLVTLTGSSRTTGQTSQCRTSYLPKEILWGHRFVNMISYDEIENVYEVDYDKFDETIEFDTLPVSARELEEVIDESEELSESDASTYYNENLNYIGHSVTQNYEQLTIVEPTPGTSGLTRSQSEQYTIRLQNAYNNRSGNKWQNELLSNFSQQSLVTYKELKGSEYV